MKKLILIFFILISNINFAQIRGKITDEKGDALSFVNVFLENTSVNSSANEKGKYELNVSKTGQYVVVFQFLGFKTKKENILVDKLPFELNVKMTEENFTLTEITINKKENPAIAIIKNAIENRKINSEKTAKYTADFYSKGCMKIKNLPKKILGQKIDIDEETASSLDSTGSGTVYLSETVSKLTYQKPNDLKEDIIASKVAGDSKGFSYNTARNTFFDFYDNAIKLNVSLISPIANNAFSYYKYKFDNSFYDENNQLINKIKVIARRDKEPVFEGSIYVVDGSWAIYAIDLSVKGYRMNNEFIEEIALKQNFNYNSKSKIWAKNSQSLAFAFGGFGIKYSGNFNYVFSNYDFKDGFEKKTFGAEMVTFNKDANKKDIEYWNVNRPMPLTDEESDNYFKKEKLQTKRESKQYKDSLDRKKNEFKLADFLTGYKFRNSFSKYSVEYDGLIGTSKIAFNTVQGFALNTNINFKKWYDLEDEDRFSSLKAVFDYGFSEKKLRVFGVFNHRFNSLNYADLTISAGSKVNQFNSSPPISSFVNSIASLFFRDNYMKLYDLNFAEIKFNQDIFNGVNMNAKVEYLHRKPLFNSSDYSYFKRNDVYSSNNPINEFDFANAGFAAHHLVRFSTGLNINFGSKYMSRPNERINIRNRKFPTLYVGAEKTFTSSEKKYEYLHLNSQIFYNLSLENLGKIATNTKAGKFFNAENISFIDYKHFNGNQTHIGSSPQYLNVFNFLPYYSNSTNDSYLEFHSEYDDNGFIMNKLPLLSALKSNLILGFHNLAVPNRKPYSELTIGLDNLGFGKIKFFRIDYIRFLENGQQNNGIICGCKILNFL